MASPTALLALDVLATAVVAGFLTMYCLTIGGYFTHMVRSGQINELQRTYPPFRRRTRLRTTYAAAMLVQLGVAVAALVAHWQAPLTGRLLAVAALPLLLVVHRLTGFTDPEEKLVSGQEVSEKEADRYRRLNVPLHAFYACFYMLAAGWVLVELV